MKKTILSVAAALAFTLSTQAMEIDYKQDLNKYATTPLSTADTVTVSDNIPTNVQDIMDKPFLEITEEDGDSHVYSYFNTLLLKVGGYHPDSFTTLNFYGQVAIELVKNGYNGRYLNPVKFIDEVGKIDQKVSFGSQKVKANGTTTTTFLYEMVHYGLELTLDKFSAMSADMKHNELLQKQNLPTWSGVKRSNLKACYSTTPSYTKNN